MAFNGSRICSEETVMVLTSFISFFQLTGTPEISKKLFRNSFIYTDNIVEVSKLRNPEDEIVNNDFLHFIMYFYIFIQVNVNNINDTSNLEIPNYNEAFDGDDTVTPDELLSFAWQIACGMVWRFIYIHKHFF